MSSEITPAEILEELADHAIAEIERLATSGFEIAIDEMVDFHKFLIDAYLTADEQGMPINLARAGDWRSLHQDWIQKYRRIFERAAEKIGDESEFVEVLAYLPMRLLPRDATRADIEITSSILSLPIILVHRIEDWLSKHRVQFAEIKPSLGVALIARDANAFRDVIFKIISAWENTLQLTGSIHGWDKQGNDLSSNWKIYVSSWPFLRTHLQNTAYMLCVAAWNDDDIGSIRFRDMLLRWFSRIGHEFNIEYHLDQDLILPVTFDRAWNLACEHLALVTDWPQWMQPDAGGIFGATLKSIHQDVITIAVGTLLSWHIEDLRGRTAPGRTALELLNWTLEDAEGEIDHFRRPIGFVPFFMSVVRILSAGEQIREAGYPGWLDELARIFDQMSEREVVSGRIYRPTTHSSRDDLIKPWLGCLLLQMDDEDTPSVIGNISKRIAHENKFGGSDSRVRDVLHFLRQAVGQLTAENYPYFEKALALKERQVETATLTNRLSGIITGVIEQIEARRTKRLEALPVDREKLDQIRNIIENAILKQSSFGPFDQFVVVRSKAQFEAHQIQVTGFSKGYLTNPELAQRPLNQEEWLENIGRNLSSQMTWRKFLQHSSEPIVVQGEDDFVATMLDRAAQIRTAGGEPILIVSGWSDPAWIEKWFGWNAQIPAALRVAKNKDQTARNYIGSVNDIDVFRFSLRASEAYLVRRDLLKEIILPSDEGEHFVDISFDEAAEGGTIQFSLRQGSVWRGDQVVIFKYPAPTAESSTAN